MGFFIVITYLPILIIFTAVAVAFSIRLNKRIQTKKSHDWHDVFVIALGAILSAASSYAMTLLISFRDNPDFEALFLKMGTSLVMPFLFGFTVVAIGKYAIEQHLRTALVIYQIGVGAFHAVWLLPWSIFIFYLIG